MKDPAFLFYSNDFYAGTRMMLPEERACYIDLMIYQHQYGYIPDDMKRVLMYCSGIDEATLKAVLLAKFKHSDKGWYNERLSQVIEKRETYSKERSVSGTVGQFWKKIKSELSPREYTKLRNKCSHLDNEEIISLIENFKNKSITTPKAMLEAMLKHIGNENEIGNENKDIEKGITKGKNIDFIPAEFQPIVSEWLQYKSDRKESYKNTRSIEKFYHNLHKMARGQPSTAQELIDTAMGNNWAGIHEKNNGRTNSHTQRETENRAGLDHLEDEAMRYLIGTAGQNHS